MEKKVFIGEHIKTKGDVYKIFAGIVPLPTCKLDPCGKPCENEYDFNNEFMGLALVISNGKFENASNRSYCEDEIKMMTEIFGHKALDFLVVAFQDLGAYQMNWVLDVAAEQVEFHQNSNCLVCVIGSHGTESPRPLDKSSDTGWRDHCLYGTDDISINTKDVINRFSDVDALENKPKLFFIQACRSEFGKALEEKIDIGQEVCFSNLNTYSNLEIPSHVGTDNKETHDVTEAKFKRYLKRVFGIGKPKDITRVSFPPCKDDCAVIYASNSGKHAHGRVGEGGWMLKALHTVMLKHLQEADISK